MKTKTQKQAVLQLFLAGQTLNWLSCFKQTGCSSVARRVPEFEEQGLVFKREQVKFKTRFGTRGKYMNYTLDLKKTPKKVLKKFQNA